MFAVENDAIIAKDRVAEAIESAKLCGGGIKEAAAVSDRIPKLCVRQFGRASPVVCESHCAPR